MTSKAERTCNTWGMQAQNIWFQPQITSSDAKHPSTHQTQRNESFNSNVIIWCSPIRSYLYSNHYHAWEKNAVELSFSFCQVHAFPVMKPKIVELLASSFTVWEMLFKLKIKNKKQNKTAQNWTPVWPPNITM